MCLSCFSRRALFGLPALLAGATALCPARPVRAAGAPLRIGYLPITDAAPLLVAHARGLFEAEGIRADRPVLLRSWAQVIEAFVAGQVDVVHLLAPMAIWARFGSRVPLKVVAWNHVGGSGLAVARDVARLADLGGRTVAVPFWYSIHNVVLQALLAEAGLTPVIRRRGSLAREEVGLVVMPPADMPPALAAGQIGGYIVAEPFVATAEAMGIGRVLRFTGDVWRHHACCVVAMHERDIETRPDWAQGVVHAIVKAQLWLRTHRAEAAQLLSRENPHRYTPHPAAVLARVLAPDPSERAGYLASGALRHAEWQDARIDFQPYPFPSYTEELVRRLKSTLVEGERGFLDALDPAAAAAELVEDRPVRRALAAVGGLAAFGLPEAFSRQEVIAP
ncbi:MAG: ABC transporter substrate-binding protein [Rhodovarius sp.]|nr:ABC transporter substrate-binding protein [Rhodovarius sp.]